MISKYDLSNKTFAGLSDITRHARITHENHRHECGIRHQLFTRQYILTKHKKLHAKVIINSNIE